MINTIVNSFDIWTDAQGLKAKGRVKSIENISMEGISRVRELILELAIRGKLVQQEPNDEPVKNLLEKISTLKSKLIKEKKIKDDSSSPALKQCPFQLPSKWEWCYLNNLGIIGSSSRVHQKDWQTTGIPFYRAREIVLLSKNGFVKNELFITENHYNQLKENSIVPEENDIMITGVGTIGVPYVVNKNDLFYFKDASVLIFKNIYNLYPNYLKLFLSSKFWDKEIHKDSMGTTVDTLTISRAKLIPISVPPLAEQHRIVAKVDELMTLCDKLEKEQFKNLKTHQALVKTILETLTQATDANELQAAWERMAEHFDTLFCTEDSIEQLKQAILQLAVTGKLVKQDLNDEPASELLIRIKNGRDNKKEANVSEIKENEKPFTLPQGWEWIRLQQIIQISSGNGLVSTNMNSSGNIPVFGGNGINGYHDKGNITKPTLVIGRVGYYCGSIHITPSLAWVTDNAFITSFSEDNIYLNYLYWLLKGTNLKENNSATAQPVISGRKIYPIVVALPPLNEQKRIVDKIEEMFAICESLRNNISKSEDLKVLLSKTIIEKAVE